MDIKDQIYNINGKYVKFYFTTNPNLPQLLKNTGSIVVLLDYSTTLDTDNNLEETNQKEKVFSMWIGGECLFEGKGFNTTLKNYIINNFSQIIQKLSTIKDNYVFNGQYIDDPEYQIPAIENLDNIDTDSNIKLANISDNFIYVTDINNEDIIYPVKLKYLSNYIKFLFETYNISNLVDIKSATFNIEYESALNGGKISNIKYTKYGSSIISSDIDYISLHLDDTIHKLSISLNIDIKNPNIKISKAQLSCKNISKNIEFTQIQELNDNFENSNINNSDNNQVTSYQLTFIYNLINRQEHIQILNTNQIILDEFILSLTYEYQTPVKINDNINSKNTSSENNSSNNSSSTFDININQNIYNISLSKIGVLVDSKIFMISEIDHTNKTFNCVSFDDDNNIQLTYNISNSYYKNSQYYCPCILVNHKYNIKNIYAIKTLKDLFNDEEQKTYKQKTYININHRVLHNNEYITNSNKLFISNTQDEGEFDIYYLNVLNDLEFIMSNPLFNDEYQIYYHVELEDRNTNNTFKKLLFTELNNNELYNRIIRSDLDYTQDKYISSPFYENFELINYNSNTSEQITSNNLSTSIIQTNIKSLDTKLKKLYLNYI